MDPFTPLSDRIRRFLDASRSRGGGTTFSPKALNQNKAFFELHSRKPFWERYARSLAYAIENEPVSLFDDEQIVGMLYQAPSDQGLDLEENKKRWAEYCPWHRMHQRQAREIDPFVGGGGAPGHIGWRWDIILEKGIDELIREIRALLANAQDAKAKRLYKGALILWRSVLKWNDRHVAALKEKASRVQGEERERIARLIEICTRVPREPARTFHEAVQAFHFQHLVVMFENPYGGNGPGRVDYFLWPYLERDLATGRTTMEQAKDLVDELWIRFEERIQHRDGWVESAAVGGLHPDGSSSVNPLSHMMIDSFAALDQTHPAMYPRVGHNTPEPFVDLCVNYLLHGKNRAQIYNDDVCVRAIVQSGTPPEDARMYMPGGCMEISVQGMNCDLNWSRTHNVAKTLELVLNGGVDMLTGNKLIPHDRRLADYTDFEDLYAAFETELGREYEEMVKGLDIASECYAKYRPCYLLSSLMNDCLARGREQQDGGARYHEYGFAPLAISTAADSLNGIKRAVFEEKFVTAAVLIEALRADFKGHEQLQARLRNLPKYGAEDPEADALADRVLKSVCTLATAPRARFGGQLKPMVFNFVWTPGTSAQLAARGDGSNAGDRIAHGMTPQPSAMKNGLTAAINSCTSLSFDCVSGGATTMWDMDEQWISFDLMKSVLTTFLKQGGMIFQGNTTSVKELEEAMRSPEKYPNLIVRVGGFSAHFVALDPTLQREIVTRYRHAG